jgi:preprotein translocase subunit SecE
MNIIEFLKGTRTELAKVVWPSRKETVRYTFTVIAFSLGVALILGAFDYGLLQLVQKLLNR